MHGRCHDLPKWTGMGQNGLEQTETDLRKYRNRLREVPKWALGRVVQGVGTTWHSRAGQVPTQGLTNPKIVHLSTGQAEVFLTCTAKFPACPEFSCNADEKLFKEQSSAFL